MTGLQRHLKVLGNFARLALRDDKPHYLKELPRIKGYIMDVLQQQDELAAFYQFFSDVEEQYVTASDDFSSRAWE